MRIVLVEERDGQQRQERVYDHPTVKVGRDPAECNLVFNQSEWPMVSRHHAEFRFKNGRCLLVDTNSSFGTFLNGRRISEPVEIQPGARVQFGAGGPLMIVARVDVAAPPPPPPSSLAEMETRRDIAGAGPDDLTTPRGACGSAAGGAATNSFDCESSARSVAARDYRACARLDGQSRTHPAHKRCDAIRA